MWDIHIVARERYNDQVRRAAQRKLVAQAKAAAASREYASQQREPALAPARKAVGFALVHAGLWILVGSRRRQRAEQLAWYPERETARASGPRRS